MLGKIFKYDVKAQCKSLMPVYIITLGLSIVVRVMSMLVESFSILTSVYSFLMVICVFSLIGVGIWTAIVSVKHFYTNLLRDEGYLTNTLPVTRNQLILSKEIVCIVTLVFATIVIITCGMIAFYHGGFKDFVSTLSDAIAVHGVDFGNLLIWILVTAIISYISFIQLCFTSLMCGQMKNNNKIVFAIIFGIVIYILQSLLSTVALFIDTVISPNIMNVVMENNIVSLSSVYDYIILIFITSIVVELIAMVIKHFVSVYLANNHLNLE